MEENKLNFDDETKQRVFQQVMDIFVNPEIERRKKMNKLQSNLKLEKIQVIFPPNKKPFVRFNNEVKAIIKCKVNKSIKNGDLGFDIDSIESIKLTDKDLNYGHFTLLFFRGNWIISFNFIYNKKEIDEHIKASIEFYESAKENLKKKRLRPFFENAFASAELFTKTLILSLSQKEKGRQHEYRKKFLEDWASLGNVKPEFSTTLSKLYSLRSSISSNNHQKENPEEILDTLEEMIKFSNKLIGKTYKKEIIIVSERDKDIFDEFVIMIAGGLGALGIERILGNAIGKGFLMLGIAFLLIMGVSKWIRGKSDTKK